MTIKIEMVEIPASQDHNSFKIGKYPITQEQYKAVMGTNPSHFQGNPQNPVENVSWDDAQAFCKKLSQITGKTYRLPTEAEWEYACRAGTTTDYCFGDYFDDNCNYLKDYAWYFDNSQGTTHPVGQKKPNAWGLYDMHGNVWEWCQEVVMRGGSWGLNSVICRSAFRINYLHRGYLGSTLGFRVAETMKPMVFAEEMWEARLPEPYKDMILPEMVEYLETLQNKEEKKSF